MVNYYDEFCKSILTLDDKVQNATILKGPIKKLGFAKKKEFNSIKEDVIEILYHHILIKDGFDQALNEELGTVSWSLQVRGNTKLITVGINGMFVLVMTEPDANHDKIVDKISRLYQNVFVNVIDFIYGEKMQGRKSDETIFVIDTNGKVTDCNNAFANLMETDKELIIGRSIFDLVADESLSDAYETFPTISERKVITDWKGSFKGKKQPFPVELDMMAVHDDYDTVKEVFVILKNTPIIYQSS